MKYILYRDKCIRCRNNNKENEFIVAEHQRGFSETFDIYGDKINLDTYEHTLEKFIDNHYKLIYSFNQDSHNDIYKTKISRTKIYELLRKNPII
jgi:predicted nucleic-acid-binding Zn-ribbon protein